MTSKDQSKFKMYLTLRAFLIENSETTAKLPNFAEFMADFEAAIALIQSKNEERSHNNKGITDNKKQLRESLISIMIDNSKKMQAYAKYTKDTILMAESKFTPTGLKDVASLELLNAANGFYSLIDTHLEKVTPYTLNSETQSQYKSAITVYAEAIPLVRQSQLKNKENTLLENQGFEAADNAIENIDMLVEIIHLTEPLFYNSYKNARKIVEQGTGSLQVRGFVTESATDKPIPGAILSFRIQGTTDIVLEKETAAKGGFMIKSLAEGIYDITITKVGFKSQTITAVVRWDELCVLEVKMEGV